jgi:hypothetical protein
MKEPAREGARSEEKGGRGAREKSGGLIRFTACTWNEKVRRGTGSPTLRNTSIVI